MFPFWYHRFKFCIISLCYHVKVHYLFLNEMNGVQATGPFALRYRKVKESSSCFDTPWTRSVR